VLGSAAGGGFPQWNCGCPNCVRARTDGASGHRRTQESVAISADGDEWFLLNASPEIRAQIESFEGLHPRAPRHSPISGIVLTNGDMDHVLGLLSLRESHPLFIYATDAVRRGFSEKNVLYRTLQRFPGQVTWVHLSFGRKTHLALASGKPSGLTVTPVAVPGKPPVHLEGVAPATDEEGIGLLVQREATDETTQKTLAYFSSFGALTPEMEAVMRSADCVFADGTFWSNDELLRLGLGTKRAEDMAHAPVGGSGGTLQRLASMPGRRLFIHINNTNPMLFPDSAEAAEVRNAGVEVAHDGLEFTL
jgi:pyrroloquinoline quinone biosynthesis protein B